MTNDGSLCFSHAGGDIALSCSMPVAIPMPASVPGPAPGMSNLRLFLTTYAAGFAFFVAILF